MWKLHRKLNFPNIFRFAAIYTWATAFKSLDVNDHNIINSFKELFLTQTRTNEEHMWPIMVYPNVYCKMKSDSFSKENNKGIIFNRVPVWWEKNLKSKNEHSSRSYIVHTRYSKWFKLIGSVPGNLEIRMKKFFHIHKIS